MIAPDSFGGTLSAADAARAIAVGWRDARPDDHLVLVPLADGGEGTLDVIEGAGDERRTAEVVDPRGHPVEADWLMRADGTAVIESAAACGLHLLGATERDPLRTTTYGVGQLMEAARGAGADRVVIGLGGSATVDGGAGAMLALGYAITDEQGQGVKIGGRELHRVSQVRPRWLAPDWSRVQVTVWCDVRTPLARAAATFGPQKGASSEAVATLDRGLRSWATVVEDALGGRWRHLPGSGAAGGLGFGLAAAVGARLTGGAAAIADAVELDAALERTDLVITGEGGLDRTSGAGKVVGEIIGRGGGAGIPVAVIAGRVDAAPDGPVAVEAATSGGPGPDPAAEVADAARRLATRLELGNGGR